MNILDQIKADAHAAPILADWVGNNRVPVARVQAEYRASVCLQCPMNVPHEHWWQNFKSNIADAIRSQLSLKHSMSLELDPDTEDRLGECQPCRCVLTLLVWCPPETLREHSKPGDADNLHPDCWKRKVLAS